MTEDLANAQNLPRSIRDGIRNLFVAFPAGKPADPADMVPLVGIYAAAVEGFPVSAVERTLSEMLTVNPRNPFPPTAQDVYERLKGATGKDPKKPQMLLSEWLNCGTAQIIGYERAMEVWREKLSPEAKARAATQRVAGGQNVTPLRLAAPDEK